ncbi:MAG: energy transducer TonB, partial [Pseudomonadota bacterium]
VPVTNSIRLVSSSGGSAQAAQQAFEAGRRAIIRCGVDGFDLPPEKYEQWKEIEITFNPEQMRIR